MSLPKVTHSSDTHNLLVHYGLILDDTIQLMLEDYRWHLVIKNFGVEEGSKEQQCSFCVTGKVFSYNTKLSKLQLN